MSEAMGQVATASAEGVIRRQASELSDVNSNLELQLNRLTSVQIRMYGQNEERLNPITDCPPEPVRNDLEELQYQISSYRELTEKIGNVINAVVEL